MLRESVMLVNISEAAQPQRRHDQSILVGYGERGGRQQPQISFRCRYLPKQIAILCLAVPATIHLVDNHKRIFPDMEPGAIAQFVAITTHILLVVNDEKLTIPVADRAQCALPAANGELQTCHYKLQPELFCYKTGDICLPRPGVARINGTTTTAKHIAQALHRSDLVDIGTDGNAPIVDIPNHAGRRGTHNRRRFLVNALNNNRFRQWIYNIH